VPVAFYSCKLTSAQCNYSVGKKELLSVVETLKEFCTMLYGCPEIHIYTDHKNNTFTRFQTQCVLQWRLFLDDYNVHLQYIKGNSNLLADALSRLPFDERQNTYASPTSSSKPSMPSICQNHGYSWDKYNFRNYTDSKGQGAPVRVQGDGKPFETTQGDKKSSEVRYQKSYDLLDNLRNYDFSLSVGTYLLTMDPMDHFMC
jgi:RNase H-like domain found in reverse transcriptase